MIFKNKKNNQVANIIDIKLIDEYKSNSDWVQIDSYNFKNKYQNVDYEKEARMIEIKTRLNKISEDIIQSQCGEVIPKLTDKKKEFVILHNELRVLEGKYERTTTN